MSEWFERLPDNGIVTTIEVAKLLNVSSKAILSRVKRNTFPKPDNERHYRTRKRFEWYVGTIRKYQAQEHEQ